MFEFLQLISETLSVKSSIVGEIFGLEVTNTMVTGLLLTFLVMIIAFWVSRFRLRNPGKSQIALEYVIESIAALIKQIAGEVKLGTSILAILVSFILIILFSNLMTTILPFLDSFSLNGQNLFRTYTADFNTTLTLAVLGVLLTQVVAIKNRGFFNHLFSYIQIPQFFGSFVKGPKAIFDAFIAMMVGFLDIISEFARVISLSLRLFGNLYAGVILLGVFASFLAVILPLPILLLSTLSGVVQAIVFGALVTSYIAGVSEVEKIEDNLNAKGA